MGLVLGRLEASGKGDTWCVCGGTQRQARGGRRNGVRKGEGDLKGKGGNVFFLNFVLKSKTVNQY